MSSDPQEPNPGSALTQLDRALAAVTELINGIRDDQWDAPTPCTDWAVRDVVLHLDGTNRVITALLTDQPLPERPSDPRRAVPDPVAAFHASAVALSAAFAQPGVLDRVMAGPLGSASGADRLRLRIADLLAHGWDLAQATGQPAALPEDLARRSLEFSRGLLTDAARPGRFAPAQPVAENAPAIDRLVAFLGRRVPAARSQPPPAS